MVAIRAFSAAQAELDLETDVDRQRELNRQHQLFEELLGAIRAATIARGGAKLVAAALDDLWGSPAHGRGVSESKYRACLADDGERNYFRVEWIIELALNPEVADVLRRIVDGKSEKDPREELEDLRALVREELPKRAGDIIRKASSTRRRR